MVLDMANNRVVQGRMVTPEKLAELIEGESVLEVEEIQDAEKPCPECAGNVITVTYMPDITSLATGLKCQDCDWSQTEIN